jgi:hypothetical protein
MLAVILGLLLILAGFMRLSVAGASSAGAAQYTIGIVEARMSPRVPGVGDVPLAQSEARLLPLRRDGR